MTGDDVGLTQRDLLLEVRADLRNLTDKLDAVTREQALNQERRSAMSAKAALIETRLDEHDEAILDLRKWRDEAAGAMRLARWAFGSSLLASVLLVIQIVTAVMHAVNPALP